MYSVVIQGSRPKSGGSVSKRLDLSNLYVKLLTRCVFVHDCVPTSCNYVVATGSVMELECMCSVT